MDEMLHTLAGTGLTAEQYAQRVEDIDWLLFELAREEWEAEEDYQLRTAYNGVSRDMF